MPNLHGRPTPGAPAGLGPTPANEFTSYSFLAVAAKSATGAASRLVGCPGREGGAPARYRSARCLSFLRRSDRAVERSGRGEEESGWRWSGSLIHKGAGLDSLAPLGLPRGPTNLEVPCMYVRTNYLCTLCLRSTYFLSMRALRLCVHEMGTGLHERKSQASTN